LNEGRRKKEEGRGLQDMDSDPNSKDKTYPKTLSNPSSLAYLAVNHS
jgi:hypothetical protein